MFQFGNTCFFQTFLILSSSTEDMAQQEEKDRTKKRDPGKITRAIKVALVGDGTVQNTNQYETSILANRKH